MFSSLRFKFVAIIMIIVGLVMAVSFSALCAYKYRSDVADVTEALSGAVSSAIRSDMFSLDRAGAEDLLFMFDSIFTNFEEDETRQTPSSGSASTTSSSGSSDDGVRNTSTTTSRNQESTENANIGIGKKSATISNASNSNKNTNTSKGNLAANATSNSNANANSNSNSRTENVGSSNTSHNIKLEKQGNVETDSNANATDSSNAAGQETGTNPTDTTNQDNPQTADPTPSNPSTQNNNAETKSESADKESKQQLPWLEERKSPSQKQEESPSIEMGNGRGTKASNLIPIATYKIKSDGDISLVSRNTTASVSDEISQAALSIAATSPDGPGSIDSLDLVYYKEESEDNDIYVAFTDSSYANGWKRFAAALGMIWLGAMSVLFVVSLFFSRWALRPVKKAWDSQRQFVADASHDLKTPLTVILANMSILLQSPDKTIASESQWIENTQKEANGMQQLVTEMLELAQVEAAPEHEQIRKPVDLGQLVEGEGLLFDAIALEGGYNFSCELERGVTVMGDPVQLSKMFKTIFENAFKYAGKGGTVSTSLSISGKDAIVAIANSGTPIPEEDIPHVFDRFYRSDKARTSGRGGFGLGLAISKQIALVHGGDISCTSGMGGTVFSVRLPIAR